MGIFDAIGGFLFGGGGGGGGMFSDSYSTSWNPYDHVNATVGGLSVNQRDYTPLIIGGLAIIVAVGAVVIAAKKK